MGKKIYVTFWIQSIFNGYGKYAVRCGSEQEARELAADANSLHGIKYLKLNLSGKIKKEYKLIEDSANYLKYL